MLGKPLYSEVIGGFTRVPFQMLHDTVIAVARRLAVTLDQRQSAGIEERKPGRESLSVKLGIETPGGGEENLEEVLTIEFNGARYLAIKVNLIRLGRGVVRFALGHSGQWRKIPLSHPDMDDATRVEQCSVFELLNVTK